MLPDCISRPNPSIYTTGRYVVVDFETTSEEKGSPYNAANQLVLACWTCSWDDKPKAKWGDELEQMELLQDIAAADFIVAHNAKFELGWLDRCGLDLHDVLVFDTMLAEWVLLSNRANGLHDLGLALSLARYGLKGKEDVVGGMIKLGINPLNIPKSLLQTYCMEDVRATEELFHAQLKLLEKQEQLHLVYSRCLLTPVLVDIEKTGVCLDKDAVEKEWQKVSKEHAQAKAKLDAIALSLGEEVNFDSPKQVGKLLYEKLGFEEVKDHKGNPIRTASGAASTAASVVGRLRAATKLQRQFVAAYQEFSDASNKLSKVLNFFKAVCDERNCIFYGIFNQGTTDTGRLSSSGRKITTNAGTFGAQLQNMPRAYKGLVIPRRKGWSVLDSDGSQIEFRCAADLGNDPIAMDEIARHEDIHSITAKALTEAGEPTTRQEAKSRTFRPLYGGTSGTKAEQEYCKFFQNKYKGIYEEQTRWTHEVLKTGKLRTKYGMMFYWPGTRISRSGFISNTTSIFNYPIQCLATAEIIPIVLFVLWHRLRGRQVEFVLTVHDSIVLEVGPDVDLEELKTIVAKAFTEDVYDYLEKCYGYTFHVPLGCGIKCGERWGAGKEIQAQMFNSDRLLEWREK